MRRGILGAVLLVAALSALPAQGAAGDAPPRAVTLAAGPGPIMEPNANVVTADALPTAQMNGVAWSQVVVGNTVYVGGSFSAARPYGAAVGTQEVPRHNLLAYNLTTGQLISSFAPSTNAQVRAVAASPDGSVLYVGGDFTTLSGARAGHVAAISTSTGQPLAAFKTSVGGTVTSLVATASTLYMGGGFTSVNGVSRGHLAAVTAGTGALTAWRPGTTGAVFAMVMTTDHSKLVVGGDFEKLNGQSVYGIGAVDPTSGANKTWLTSNWVRDFGPAEAVLSLATDGQAVYGTGYTYAGQLDRSYEGTWSASPTDGRLNWLEDCHGDTYSVFAVNAIVYSSGHAHDCSTLRAWPDTRPRLFRYLLAWTTQVTGTLLHHHGGSAYWDFTGYPAPSMYNFYPDFKTGTYTGKSQAVWSLAGDSRYIVAGGEFLAVNGRRQQGLVRFALRGTPGNPGAQGPQLSRSAFTPTLRATATAVTVSFPSNWDRDDLTLTYAVTRNGTVVWRHTSQATWWNRPTLSFTDIGLKPGTKYTYAITATDPHGNSVSGAPVSVTTL